MNDAGGTGSRHLHGNSGNGGSRSSEWRWARGESRAIDGKLGWAVNMGRWSKDLAHGEWCWRGRFAGKHIDQNNGDAHRDAHKEEGEGVVRRS